VFDRITGKPVWPIEEQPVPASSVPGERAAKTQPFPTKPAPIDIQGVRDEDLIDLTPEIHKEAIDTVAKYDRGPLFTPPSERGAIQVPGVAGGGNWAGAAIDPETGMLYAGTYRLPFVVTVESSYDFVGEFRYLSGPRGLPLLKPPFGSIVAIDMNTGEHRWRIPIGRGELIPPIQQLGIKERLGFPARSWALVTKTVMIVVQSGYFGAPRLAPGARGGSMTSTISIRICGCTIRPTAKCWRRLPCQPTRSAPRSPIWRAASNISRFPSAAALWSRS
jgi:quinoprotein glucose dehydrogenase